MNRTFRPHMEILPLAQQRLWPELRQASALGFTLYGGTAVALRLGHRSSVDFDFFSGTPLDRSAIKAAFPFVARSTTLQDQDDAWVLLAGNTAQEYVKVSFFSKAKLGRVGEPDSTEDGVLEVASFDDLMATKLKVILQRAEAKDYRNIAAMLRAGISVPRGLAAASTLFGPNFQPSESLKALVHFNDGDLDTLTNAEKNTLIDTVKAVRGDLPEMPRLSWRLVSRPPDPE